jgi:hypothetical protein
MEREWWRAPDLSRGSFRVIEFWVENRVMSEVFTQEMTEECLDCVMKGINGYAARRLHAELRMGVVVAPDVRALAKTH